MALTARFIQAWWWFYGITHPHIHHAPARGSAAWFLGPHDTHFMFNPYRASFGGAATAVVVLLAALLLLVPVIHRERRARQSADVLFLEQTVAIKEARLADLEAYRATCEEIYR